MPRDKRLYMTFPNDVHRHPKIMRLSLEARWAFIEMNGEARIADNDGVFSRDEAEFLWPQSVLDELCSSHPSRPLVVRDGETYVIRDYAEHQQTRAEREELSAKKAAAGAKGGRAKADNLLAGAKQVPSGVKQNLAEIESELEIKLEEQDQTLIAAAPRIDLFDEAYSAWPKKVEKAESRKRWAQAVKKHPSGEVGLLEAVRQFGAAYAMHRERQYTPSLASWLNRERWTDELPQPDPVRRGSLTAVEHNMDLYLREKARMEAEQGNPMREIGGVA